ncbi:small nuclear ribonucleo protein polypeptide G-like protein [Catenaria anguillulae PL171]|uniref:Small nuclear ribonucleoprotein G n=1 Tax=Catenaria anguillulae PL171 TaxID=765915 RepID=A0A1Y2HN94_9FUNG|nr:small nuclear ribonucleo protein polypeptide G-like protein [Catenaria anguillulae PL171]
MVKAPQPELKKYMDRQVVCELNAGRKVSGVLRGFDPFLNIVLDNAYEELAGGEKHPVGTIVLRGNAIVLIEALDRIY